MVLPLLNLTQNIDETYPTASLHRLVVTPAGNPLAQERPARRVVQRRKRGQPNEDGWIISSCHIPSRSYSCDMKYIPPASLRRTFIYLDQVISILVIKYYLRELFFCNYVVNIKPLYDLNLVAEFFIAIYGGTPCST